MARKPQKIFHVAGLKWGSAFSTLPVGFTRRQSFRAVIWRLSRTLLATVRSVQENGLRLCRPAPGKAPLQLWFGSTEWRTRISKLGAAPGLPQAASNIEWRKLLKMPGCYLWDL